MKQCPYITEIEEKILKIKYVNNLSHIVISENLTLDYEKYNIQKEVLNINGEAAKKSPHKNVYILKNKPPKDTITLSVDYTGRIKLLKSLTLRYLIISALNKYMNLKPVNFKSKFESSTFMIKNLYFKNQAEDVKNVLEKVIPHYINSALNINNVKNKNVIIDGIYDGDFICPHLSNVSEILNFEISSYTFTNNGIVFEYK